jgi:hypothetical protein
MKRIRLLVAMAVLATAGGISASVATVSAGPGRARMTGITRPPAPVAAPACPRGDVCGWTRKNYSGTRGALEETNTTLPAIPWHQIQSLWNNGRYCSVWMYRGADFNSEAGHVVRLLRHTGYNDMLKSVPGLYKHVYSDHWCTAG